MNSIQQNTTKKFIDLNAVSQICSLGKSTVLLWESQGRFPKAVRLSKTKRVWLASDIDKWIEKMYEAKQMKMENSYA
jgi:predicted DNA-binding transcriptional regulator AlpA